ncbi:MAG: GNAT family N-acetyltransferase [Bacteroidetes bacterium]|nr:GNAT family N-acetyltransferase [Bacteroidota bacterium]
MFIRHAELHDLDKIIEVISLCSKQLHELGIEQWGSKFPTREMIAEDIKKGYVYAGIDEESEVLIGTLTIGSEKNEDHHSHICWEQQTERYIFFNRLAVLPQFQKRGYASQFMDFAETYAEKEGAESLRLDARTESSRVLNMYIKRGYHSKGSVAYRNGTRKYTVMEKLLPKTEMVHIKPPYHISSKVFTLFQQALTIRKEVFVIGQHVDPAIDQDGKDSNLEHFIVMRGNEPAGCLRFRPLDNAVVKLERIAILSQFRSLGLGKKLVQAAVEEAIQCNFKKLTMNAQYYLLDYYGNLGFSAVGEPFLEAEIKHITMEYIF